MLDSIPRPAIVSSRQRSAESPSLWLLLLAGSLLLHIALFFILRPFWVERAGGQGGSGSVEIELVDANAITGQTSLPSKAFSPSAGPIAAIPITPAPIAATPSTPPPENDQEIQAPPRSQPTPAPSMSPSLSPLNSPLQGQPKATSKPNLAPSQPLSKPSPTLESTPTPPVKTTPTPSPQLLRSGEILPSASTRSDEIRVGSPQRAPEDVQDTVRTETSPSEISGGGGLRLTIVGLPRSPERDGLSPGADVPEQIAQPLQNSALFSEALPACVRGAIGRKLTLRVAIDDTGYLHIGNDRASTADMSCTIENVHQFIEALVQRKFRFHPAKRAGKEIPSIVNIDVQLNLLQ